MTMMDMRAEHRQGQTLSPRLQHAVRLLQMSSLDFSALVRDALDKNPFLETDEGGDGSGGIGANGLGQSAASAPGLPDGGLDFSTTHAAGEGGPDADSASAFDDLGRDAGDDAMQRDDGGRADDPCDGADDSDRDLWSADGGSAARRGEADGLSALDRMAVETSLTTQLHGQLNLLPLPPRDLLLARTIVESLDDDGYLRTPLEELIEEVCARIRRLDPRPGWRFGVTQVSYVVPDVIVRKVRGQWTVQLNPAVVPKVRLNRVYEALFERHRSAQNTEMTAHLNEARWTVRNVEQRFLTILDVANVIVRKQKNFLEYGAMAMKPLSLKQIADEVGVHESTVSRVTNNKYRATPAGVFELKYFFSRAMSTVSGGACSGIAIRGLLMDIIDAESPDAPLSDADITRQLAHQGLVVARRTVTKYRQMLKIKAVDRRNGTPSLPEARRTCTGIADAGATTVTVVR